MIVPSGGAFDTGVLQFQPTQDVVLISSFPLPPIS